MMYLLDTNTVSRIIRKDSKNLIEKLLVTPMASLAISSITEAELMYGLRKKPEAWKLKEQIVEFLVRVRRLPWTSETAAVYGELRHLSRSSGITINSLDLLIASHASETNRVLVTNDSAFRRLTPWILIEDWV